jgi:hypothetical protein
MSRGHDVAVQCICHSRRRRLDGDAAFAYAAEHLNRVWSDGHDLTGFVCPDTGVLWILDDPHTDLAGFGPATLRVVAPDLWEAAQRSDFRAP